MLEGLNSRAMRRPQIRMIRLGFMVADQGNCRSGHDYGRETEAGLNDDQHELRLGAVRQATLWATEGRGCNAQLTVPPRMSGMRLVCDT